MDREQEEMQFLGLFGICKESFKIILSWRKIFTQITLTLILPLAFIFLAHMEITHSLFRDIKHTEYEKEITRPGTTRYERLSDTLSSEWVTFWLFKLAYFTLLLVLSLLSTAAVVYTIASAYTGRQPTYKTVMTVVPKVWRRLMVTFLTTFAAFFVYNFLAFFVLFLAVFLLPYPFAVFAMYVVLVAYVVGLVYLTVIWQLASVVSVLEPTRGLKAIAKSKELIKGSRWVAVVIFFVLNLSLVVIQIAFESWVVHGGALAMWKRVWLGIACFVGLVTLFLWGLVIQTVVYLVCKSYHHENIDKGDLSNHLESYLGDYEPLSGKDVQLEQYQV